MHAELGGGTCEAEKMPLAAESDGRFEAKSVLPVDGVT